jgi:glycerol-3-phosphate acyltransferase PlsY
MLMAVEAVAVLAVAWLAGSIPFSNLVARRARGVDLRTVDTGTVSGTNLFRVAGFGPLALAGVLDVGKGALGPALAGGHRPVLQAVAGAAAVAGHNWSPFLRAAGGRGISPALGATLATAWPGTVVLLAGLVGGKAVGQTGLGSFVAAVLLVPVLALTRGHTGALVGVTLAVPMLAKRVAGNHPPPVPSRHVYVSRLLFDRDAPR